MGRFNFNQMHLRGGTPNGAQMMTNSMAEIPVGNMNSAAIPSSAEVGGLVVSMTT